MAAGVPPPPLNSPNGSYYWLEWYTNLTNFLNGTNIPWTSLNFTGSDIADILTRNHNELTKIQGGTASGARGGGGSAYHMSGRGYVSEAGAGTGFPGGWSVAHTGTGVYTITHNLGITIPNISATATSNTSGVVVQWIDLSSSSAVVVHTTNPGGTATDGSFSLTVMT